jgi:hypothetical protein
MYSSLRNVCNDGNSKLFLHSSQEKSNGSDKNIFSMLDTAQLFTRIQKALRIEEPVEIAKFLNVTKQTVYRWRDGEPPKLETLGVIAAQNETNLHWLLTGEGEEKITPKAEGNQASQLLSNHSLPEVFNLLLERLGSVEKDIAGLKSQPISNNVLSIIAKRNTSLDIIYRVIQGDTKGLDLQLVRDIQNDLESSADELSEKRVKNSR